jgi:hypothetical protein
MEILRFAPEVPVEVALKFPTGKLVQGNHGKDMMYTLVDGRLMFLEQGVAVQLDTLRIAPGEPFWITRNAGRPGVKGSVSWDIRRPQAGARCQVPGVSTPQPAAAPPVFWAPEEEGHGFAAPPANGNGHAAAANGGSNGHAPAAANGASANGHTAAAADVKTQAESAVMTAIEACSKGEKYAKSLGFPLSFEAEDVRAIAATILIGMQKNSGKR